MNGKQEINEQLTFGLDPQNLDDLTLSNIVSLSGKLIFFLFIATSFVFIYLLFIFFKFISGIPRLLHIDKEANRHVQDKH